MSSAFLHVPQRYLSAAVGGYVVFAASLTMILVVLTEGWLW